MVRRTDGRTDEGNSLDNIFEVPAEVTQFTRKKTEDGAASKLALFGVLYSFVHTVFSNI